MFNIYNITHSGPKVASSHAKKYKKFCQYNFFLIRAKIMCFIVYSPKMSKSWGTKTV